VAANLTVLDQALDHAQSREPLTVPILLRWHQELMRGHTNLPERLVGAFRDEVGWIGGSSPLDAALVVTPPEAVGQLVDDLIYYLNTGTDDPVADAAVIHAQFEVIHPFGDGNGRLGRVLILWLLARRTGIRVLPPLSTRIAADRGGYLAGLTTWRLIGADPWIRWFADTVTDSAGAVQSVSGHLDTLTATWTHQLDQAGIRSDAAARRLAAALPAQPVFTSRTAAETLNISERVARNAITTLTAIGIVQPLRLQSSAPIGAHWARWWSAPAVLDLISAN
jgi:Fic family protein